MRNRVFVILLVGLLALAALPPVLWPSVPRVAVAQDGSTPATAAPTVPPPISLNDAFAVVTLPFSESFSSNWGWIPTGAWRFDPVAGYEGGGWFLDGAQREASHTLAYVSLIDLSGIQGTRLVYRQQSSLPTTDLIAVEISLDSGNTWLLVDQQSGIQPYWDQHTVDLSAYQGQIVRLRFRVETGTAAEPVGAGQGYWIDDLLIENFVPTIAAPAPAPVYTGPMTLMGLHVLNGSRQNEVLELVQRLKSAGIPMGTIKGLNGAEDLLNQVELISPETVTVYRSLYTVDDAGLWVVGDCPDPSGPAASVARAWFTRQEPFWSQVNADYFEYMNECGGPSLQWIVDFSIESMKIANEQGRCLLLFSFPGGNPEPDEYDVTLPAYRFALENPCQPGRYHGVAMHAYSMQDDLLVSDSGDYLGYRHRQYYARILPQLPEAGRLPVYITEAGQGGGTFMLWEKWSCEDITRDVIQYTTGLQQDSYVKGFHLWNIGEGDIWVDYSSCLGMFGDALIAYYQ
ncbi:MAG: hypothetical protein JW966_01660 [Anaerolineae bacterium]|nr:hypothetical protein [Anaerolineae bacterium]